jgi:hypothetical protein
MSIKNPVIEKNYTFLKKVVGLQDEIIIKTTTTQENGNDVMKSSVCVSDEDHGFVVYSIQNGFAFSGSNFGIRNVKTFLKHIGSFKEIEETDNNVVFSDETQKITYRKLDSAMLTDYPIPTIDPKGYVSIPINKSDIENINKGLGNKFSDYARIIIDGDKVIFKIGELAYENFYEVELKKLAKTEAHKVVFLSKVDYFEKLFKYLSLDNNAIEGENTIALFIKNDCPLICVEKNNLTSTKFFIANIARDEGSTEE